MSTTSMSSSTGLRLLEDHRHLEDLFSRMLEDMHAGEWRRCQETWSRFERELLDHMDAEEAFVLPSFERVNPLETLALREEHGTVRRLLADMGVRLELHTVKEEHVRALVESLRAHAAREDALLYRFAADLAPGLQEKLLNRIKMHSSNP